MSEPIKTADELADKYVRGIFPVWARASAEYWESVLGFKAGYTAASTRERELVEEIEQLKLAIDITCVPAGWREIWLSQRQAIVREELKNKSLEWFRDQVNKSYYGFYDPKEAGGVAYDLIQRQRKEIEELRSAAVGMNAQINIECRHWMHEAEKNKSLEAQVKCLEGALKEIQDVCGTINKSSFTQTIVAVNGALELSEEALSQLKKLREGQK